MRKKAPFKDPNLATAAMFHQEDGGGYHNEAEYEKKSGSKPKARPSDQMEIMVLDPYDAVNNTFSKIGLYKSSLSHKNRKQKIGEGKRSRSIDLFEVIVCPYGERDLEVYLYRSWNILPEQVKALKDLIKREGVRIVSMQYVEVDLSVETQVKSRITGTVSPTKKGK